MPTICYKKPNRSKPRHYTAKDCGRIVCRAIQTGANPVEVRKEVSRCAPCDPKDKGDADALLKALEFALEGIGIAVTLFTLLTPLGRVLKLVSALPMVSRLLGTTKVGDDFARLMQGAARISETKATLQGSLPILEAVKSDALQALMRITR